MKNWKRFSVIGLVAALPLVSAVAIAFPKVSAWHGLATAVSPGASDIYATGGVSDWGLTCANCHIKAPGLINATVLPVLPMAGWPKKGGLNAYVPSTSYQVTVTLVGEHLAVNDATFNNLNSFALTIEDQNGKPKGVFTTDGMGSFKVISNLGACLTKTSALPLGNWETQPPSTYNNATGTTFLVGDCHAIVNLTIPNRTNWTFTWTAPAAGTGPLTVYYGVVDGSSHGLNSQDDDVKMGTIKLVEGP